MAFPSFRDLIEPLLRVLADAPNGLAARDAQDLVAERTQMPEEDRALRVPGGTQVLFRHRTNWAHDRLKRAGLSATPTRGVWQLTTKGIALVSTKSGPLTPQELRELAKAGRDVPINACASMASETRRKGLLGRDAPLAYEVPDARHDKRGLSA
ncbi:MAG: restriction endonuclease [Myxococcales bacterium]|nr:restriction endonuclease [Myxococcales bacterium]